jgi:uncharacterized Tic20 family protein
MEGQASPGWYPTPEGTQRYWDGNRWTEHSAPAGVSPPTANSGLDDNTWVLIAHLSPLILYATGALAFLGPLVVWLLNKDRSDHVAYHAKESLNFQLTMLLAALVSLLLVFVLVGFFLLLIVFVVSVVFPIRAAIVAGRGEQYRYPLTIRFIS